MIDCKNILGNPMVTTKPVDRGDQQVTLSWALTRRGAQEFSCCVCREGPIGRLCPGPLDSSRRNWLQGSFNRGGAAFQCRCCWQLSGVWDQAPSDWVTEAPFLNGRIHERKELYCCLLPLFNLPWPGESVKWLWLTEWTLKSSKLTNCFSCMGNREFPFMRQLEEKVAWLK